MALDPSLSGRVYPALPPFVVGREKILEFAVSIGADDAVYRDPKVAAEWGYPDVIAPPTFAILLANLASPAVTHDPALGLDYARVVHGDQRFAYRRPIQAGDRLVVVPTIEDIMTRAGHGFVTTRMDITTDQGEPVVTVWTRLIERGED